MVMSIYVLKIGKEVSMGNIMQEEIFKIWIGKTLTKFRKI